MRSISYSGLTAVAALSVALLVSGCSKKTDVSAANTSDNASALAAAPTANAPDASAMSANSPATNAPVAAADAQRNGPGLTNRGLAPPPNARK